MNRQTNEQAAWALGLGLAGFFCCGAFTGIPAIILGVLGQRRAREMSGAGDGQAIAGMVLGIVSVLVTIATVVIYGAVILAEVAKNFL